MIAFAQNCSRLKIASHRQSASPAQAQAADPASEFGYKITIYRDLDTERYYPIITANPPAEIIFDLLQSLLTLMPELVSIMLERLYENQDPFTRKEIDRFILASILLQFQALVELDTRTEFTITSLDQENEFTLAANKRFLIRGFCPFLKKALTCLQQFHLGPLAAMPNSAGSVQLHTTSQNLRNQYQELCDNLNL